MSHFMVWVLVPDVPGQDVEAEVGRLLAPFDENLEVPEYECECGCVSSVAVTEVCARFNPQLVELRLSFRAKYAEQIKDPAWMHTDESDELWEAHTKAWAAERQRAMESHRAWGKPDPSCSQCSGTGKHPSTYNPKSKWDWYVVGGRYSGVIQQAEVPMNQESFGDWPYGPGREELRDNVATVANVLERLNGEIDTDWFPPFALVTPDGEWHERGHMGWWAIVTDAKPRTDWGEEARALLAAHPNHIAVSLDCHI